MDSAQYPPNETQPHSYFESLRLQNSQLPIYRLPPELLILIFLFVRDSIDRFIREQNPTPLTTSWVSFYWREIALSSPILWTFLNHRNDEIINLFLSRSRNTKLSVDMTANSPNDYIPVFEELGRIESLSLMCPDLDEDEGEPMHDDSLLEPYWSQPAPYLKTLSLTNFPIPLHPFDDICPALRDVELIWCAFDVYAFPFGTVTDLTLNLPQDLLKPAEILLALQQMPFLESLTLEATLLGTSNDTPIRHKLARLKNIEVTTVNTTSLLDFLRRISIPPSADVNIAPEDSGDSVPSIMTELRASHDGVSKSIYALELEVHENSLYLNTTIHEEGAIVNCAFRKWLFDHHVVDELLRYYDLSQLTDLNLESKCQHIFADVWTTVFHSLPNLAILSLSDSFTTTFINHLSHSVTPPAPVPTSNTKVEDIAHQVHSGLVFPSMKKLFLAAGDLVDGHVEGEVAWPESFELFRKALDIRRREGKNLQELQVIGFILSAEQREGLRGVVGQFGYRKSWLYSAQRIG